MHRLPVGGRTVQGERLEVFDQDVRAKQQQAEEKTEKNVILPILYLFMGTKKGEIYNASRFLRIINKLSISSM